MADRTGQDHVAHISGNIVDLFRSEIYPGTIVVQNNRITDIRRDQRRYDTYIVPGLVDAHVHIESSMLVPSEFARLAVVHGTVATVSDPHEIANVLGVDGVVYMIENGSAVPFKFYFGAPSCVPATTFETAGAALTAKEIESLFRDRGVRYMSEMMNYPGVLHGDPLVTEKMRIAVAAGKPIDGHAPGLTGEALREYVAAGISTDHETFAYDEGKEKLSLGMKLIIREGSAAKNFDALSPLIADHPAQCMFCSDDKHPDDLASGHINELIRKGLRAGIDVMTLLRCASVNPVTHYGLDVGLLRIGDYADFIEVDSLMKFNVMRTFVNGQVVAEEGLSLLPCVPSRRINRFCDRRLIPSSFALESRGKTVNVIEAIDNQVITGRMRANATTLGGYAISDPDMDILKLAVVNRYEDVPPSVAFVKNFGLKRGALASSVAHDSHNIIAVGVKDEDICKAVNLIMESRGGLSVAHDNVHDLLPLPVAGLMTDEDGYTVAKQYNRLDHLAKQLGSFLVSPFMSLSFMALLVIPRLKLSDKGLFDGEKFEFIDIFE